MTQYACAHFMTHLPGPEVIKLEYSLKLKIKRFDWQLYFAVGNELKFYNLGAS